ncbi:MFS family permease [Bacillus mesophilus]|uniref:MFS transporter n=1 Tax=Bacillus mesophilus TaxID=1808955 RepID=A0A6M0Q555_9BACI|nr:MFS transporter [Bacillus mesophilus]MBM7661093.1 MFS family permease [Bacillus mesophilus]NEY71374.1 MFS transporter [Bacillus mesophilus]
MLNLKSRLALWKYPSILLVGIGFSNIGEWIYFIALNLIIFDMTGSALAVSGLYIIRPLATLCTNFWAGSLIDRYNKRKLMVTLDIIRALFIALLPFFSTISIIYLLVFFINMGSSMFGPTSMTYITKLIPQEQRKQFNSLHSLITSGAFLMGPAVAGMLFLIGSPLFAIYINAIALLLSGLITLVLLPDIEKQSSVCSSNNGVSLNVIRKDVLEVFEYTRRNQYVILIYLLFSGVMIIMASAVDSLEAAFAKEVLSLSDSEYGFLVTIAGAGIVFGALINSLFVEKIHTSVLIGVGTLVVSIGYIIYAFSSTFIVAAVGFFILAFFIAFSNTGFLTFYQNNIPVDVMGRIGSVYSIFQAILIIIATSIIGIFAHMVSIQIAVIIGVLVMVILSIILCMVSLLPSRSHIFQFEPIGTNGA